MNIQEWGAQAEERAAQAQAELDALGLTLWRVSVRAPSHTTPPIYIVPDPWSNQEVATHNPDSIVVLVQERENRRTA